MSNDMSLSALENGPDVEEIGAYGIEPPDADDLMCAITCPACAGECVVEDDRGREYRCQVCKGEGLVDA